MRILWPALYSALFLFQLAVHGCGTSDDLEDLVDDPSQRSKVACDVLPDSGYEVVPEFSDQATLEVVDCGLAFPSRMAITPDGEFLLVAQLRGVIEVFQRTSNGFEAAVTPLHDLGDLDVEDEAGLTGMFFGVDFDLDAEQEERRDLFVTFQRDEDDRGINIIRRLTLERTANGLSATAPVDIIRFPEATGQAHQIQNGVGLMVEDQPHILVAVGDANRFRNARDPTTSPGTLQLLKRDGSSPAGDRPWPEAPSTHAIGVRNVYGFVLLPSTVDARPTIVAYENGNTETDRGWLIRLFPESGPPAQLDLGNVGDDDADSWLAFEDLHTRAALGGGRTAVFDTISPPRAPTEVAYHPGGGPIPESVAGAASFVVAMFGESGTTTLSPGKGLELVSVTNIGGAALQSDRRLLVRRRAETEGQFRHPVPLAVDPVTGDIYLADIITGELSRLTFP